MPRDALAAGARRVMALCVWWNLALMAEFGTGLMDRQRLELRQNAYDAFVTLPRRLPASPIATSSIGTRSTGHATER